jgi:hypothetical protein
MARLPKNSPLSGASGTIGKELVFKRYGDKTVVSKYPDMTRVKPSPLQRQGRNLFREAVLFAQLINAHPALRALYASELGAGESVFHKVKQEYLNRLKE